MTKPQIQTFDAITGETSRRDMSEEEITALEQERAILPASPTDPDKETNPE